MVLKSLHVDHSPDDLDRFVKRASTEDKRIEARRSVLNAKAKRIADMRAKAAASKAAAAAATLPPAPTKESEDVVMEPTPKTEPAQTLDTLSSSLVNAPVLGSSPLHPSLPAKPESSSAPGGASSPAPTPASSTPAPAPASTPAPVSTSAPAPTPAPAAIHSATPKVEKPAPPQPTDSVIAALEESKHRISWLGLRATRDLYLAHFGKAEGGDLALLAADVERAKKAKEAGPVAGAAGGGGGDMERSQSPGRQESKEGDDGEDVKEEITEAKEEIKEDVKDITLDVPDDPVSAQAVEVPTDNAVKDVKMDS